MSKKRYLMKMIICIAKDGSVPQRAFQTLPDFLSISSSGIKGAGLGVWAEKDLPKGLVFGPYEGTIVYHAEEALKSGFSWQIRKHGRPAHYIEAGDVSKSNWLRFVNCATMESRQNLIAFQYRGQIYYRTYKPILKSCELLVWYGDGYARDLEIDLTEDDIPVNNFSAFMCKRCGCAFTTEEFLKKHVKHHGDDSSAFKHKCHLCSYSSCYAGHLRTHLLTHTGEKPHRCQHCNKRFSLKGHLNNHLLVHSGERPHQCDICGKSFSQRGPLLRHRRSHLGEKLHLCPTCGRAFVCISHLHEHVRTHTGQKPHKCSFCDYKCVQWGNLQNHIIRRHTLEFRHHCPTCGKGFLRPSHVRKHQAKKHPLQEGEVSPTPHSKVTGDVFSLPSELMSEEA